MRAPGCRARRREGRLRRFVPLAGAAAVAVLGLLGAAPSAQAHAYLSGSSPRDGDLLASAPVHLRLDFSESVQLAASHISVVDAHGNSVELTELRVVPGGVSAEGSAGGSVASDEADPERPVSLLAGLPSLPTGAYHVVWETLSSDDLHRTSGVLAFGIREAVGPVGLTESVPEGSEVAGRWILLGGVGQALGAGLAAHSLIQAVGDERARTRLRRRASLLGVAGAAAAALAAIALLASELARSGVAVLTSVYAVKWALREVGLVLLLGGLGLSARSARTPPPASWPVRWGRVTALGAVLTCLGSVFLGHFGARGGPSRVAASSLHLAAGLTWAGAVGILGLLLLTRRGLGVSAAELGPVLRVFRRPAAAAVSIIAVTGVYLASDVIGSIDAVLVTAYGRILLLKLALAGVAGMLGWRTTRRLRSRRTFRASRAVVAEGLVLLAVLGAAGALASGQPALQPELVSIGAAPTELLDGRVADLQQSITVRPNQPGDSVVLVDVHDTRRPSPGPITAVVVTVGGGGSSGSSTATRLDDGRFAARATLPEAGNTPIEVVVSRRGLPDVATTWSWTVGSSESALPVLISAVPIAGLLRVLAAGLLLGLTLAWWIGLQRARSHSPEMAAAVARGKERAAVRR